MRLRKRTCASSQDVAREVTKTSEANASLREAQNALTAAQEQKKDGSLIAEVLRAIRKENHFQELWNEGLRGG